MISNDYLEKVYAGFLGMNAGIRLGAPVEPTEWTPEIIQDVYGDIKGYVKDYKTFSADDDANGPVFFLRALYDDAKDRELTSEDVGRAWLNYTREGIGMFWWGGEGISTEHTAYNNLKNGIPAPKSGSAEVNGIVLAEQIGGQIFVDSWGLLFPGNAKKAADYAEIAARVSHDKNGIYGARFIAACITQAFSANSIKEIIEAGLNEIPTDSTYADIVNAVLSFYEKEQNNFRMCRQFLEDEWGYNKYPGICHIIPNAGVCILSLLYGKGDFARTIEIATMCGWDTDCNAGNVGTIVGVFTGISCIPDHYRKPINDFIATSSVSGYLNILDIPTFSKSLALLGYKMANQEPPVELKESYREYEIYFDFTLLGSTHGFRTDFPFKIFLRHNSEQGYQRKGSLEVFIDRMILGENGKIFYKPFYRREEFNDEKYKPTFAPQIYSGQSVSLKIYPERLQGEDFIITPYVRNTYLKEDLKLEPMIPKNEEWNHIEFTVPATEGALIDEVGFIIESPSTLTKRAFGKLFVDEFRIFGKPCYSIDFSKQAVEFLCVTPFSHHKGEWTIENGKMKVSSLTDCAAFTGNYYSKDVKISASVLPNKGFSHNMLFRAAGVQRNYQIGFDGRNQVSLIYNDFGHKRLLSIPFEWDHGVEYRFELNCKGSEISFLINHKKILSFEDSSYTRGMFGFSMLEQGESLISDIFVEEL
ncbi:MAG: ADP-ribosylglycohydrolase family protein [Bacillota bacterium]|nr:ADP-ribosylglycohydrolase family protein [Bacillota bacterium]